MNRQISEFIDYLNTKNLKSESIKCYKEDLLRYFSYLNNNDLLFTDITSIDIKNYFLYEMNNHISGKTCQRWFSSISCFYHFLFDQGYIDKYPFYKTINIPIIDKEVGFCLYDEIPNIINEYEKLNRRCKYKHAAMLNILFDTGIKSDELINLKLIDINLNKKTIHLAGLNTRIKINERTLMLSNDCVKRIRLYLKNERLKEASKSSTHFDNLFLNNQTGQPLTHGLIATALNNIEKATGIYIGLSINSIRNSLAYNLYHQGYDINYVSNYLGINNALSSLKYNKEELEDPNEVLNKYFFKKEN